MPFGVNFPFAPVKTYFLQREKFTFSIFFKEKSSLSPFMKLVLDNYKVSLRLWVGFQNSKVTY